MTTAVEMPIPFKRLAAAKTAFRSILVHVQSEPWAQMRLADAVALAKTLDATLIGIAAERAQPIAFTDAFGVAESAWIFEAQKIVHENLVKAEKAFRTATMGLSRMFLSVEEFPVPAMITASAAADLIVAGGVTPRDHDGYRWCDPAELAIKSGRPVLVMPAKGGALQARKVLVAWKNTREARRAVADAMPFLKAADEVVVLEAHEEGHGAEAQIEVDAVADMLRRHDIKTSTRTVMTIPHLVGDEILKIAAEVGADLIVSGAYGHTRLGEWAFGGVTRQLLEAGAPHLLISH